MRKYFKKEIKGFTLIELMIVIAIIAILAAILIPNFIRAREEAQLSACESNLKNISTSIEMYSTDWNGFYPGATTQGTGGGVLPTGLADTSFTPTYMQSIPSCPTDNTAYTYTVSNMNGNAFTISQNSNAHAGMGPKLTSSGATLGCVDIPCYGNSSGLHN